MQTQTTDHAPAPEEPKVPRGAHWTPERISLLRDLWDKGLSLSEIARSIGDLTRNQVVGKVHRLNLPGRPSPLLPQASAMYRKARSSSGAGAQDLSLSAVLDFPSGRRLFGLPDPVPAPEPFQSADPIVERPAARQGDEAPAVAEGVLASAPRPAPEPASEAVMVLPFQPPLGSANAVHGLRPGACKWPVGDPRDPDFHFCCRPRKGKAYCDEHARLAYMEPHARTRSTKAA